MSDRNFPGPFTVRSSAVALFIGLLFCSTLLLAQTTVGTGSIVGTVTDQSGAVVSGANVEITNTATGQKMQLTTNSSGYYNSGALSPGTYKVKVGSKGFSALETNTSVQVGNTATVNAKLSLGQETQTIEVQATQVQVNTEQNQVQGVLNANQIENLPVSGRNFLDLAQLEPGVQIQDGQNFDPTKAGYSSISFGGRFGRTARINVDGVDISDETVGTTTADIPASAIDEFQMSQSSLDLSQDLTSSGAVNVTTRSGTNTVHGEAFEFFRDHNIAANPPGGQDVPFQRNQFGGRLGGPIIKNKLFFFLDGERTKQDAVSIVNLTGTPYDGFSGGFQQPFRANDLMAKADYNFANGAKAFYRYSYFSNSLAATFGLGFSVYTNKDVTRQHVVGVDFNTGSLTHSIRFSYLKFQNQIVDSTTGSTTLPLANLGVELSSSSFFVGPNLLAPQSTPQSNHQIKYDGSKIAGSHAIRYGFSFNHLQGGGFANFYGTAPRISWTTSSNEALAATGPYTCTLPNGTVVGGANCPLNYPAERVRWGNGLGFNTLDPALGFPAGGLGPDNRLGIYVGDSWKVRPTFTLNFGLRYDRDTGRTDSDLGVIPEVNAQFPGAGNPVKQANFNFAPQLGFAWDISGHGRTVIRGGAGLYYENVIWNNVLFDRPYRLKTGAFNQVFNGCFQSQATPVTVQGGTISPSNYDPATNPNGICGNPHLGNVIPQVLAFWQQVLAGNPLDLTAHNPNYIGDYMSQGLGIPLGWFDPHYKTPRSLQLNIGIQHEIRHGMVLTADFLRNIETRSLLGIDINKVGDVSTFNPVAAQQAITDTLAACGAPSILAAAAPGGCPGIYPATTDSPAGSASMADFAFYGLGTPNDVFGVGCGLSPDAGGLGRPCAFGGINPTQNQSFLLKPIGRSTYTALQLKLTQNVTNPVPGVKMVNFQAAYSLSRFNNTGGHQETGTAGDSDQDFVIQAVDNNNPGRFYGPAILDRTHQISFGGFADVPGGFRIGLASHFYSPLSSGIIAPNFGDSAEIFRTDFTGDGTFGDPVPGTHLGEFDRGVDASQLGTLINNYNNKYGNQPTPAGQLLVANGLMTVPELQALGGVAPTVCPPPPTTAAGCDNSPGRQVNFTWLRALDLTLKWRHTFRERFTIEPSVGFYNLANFSNFNLPPNTMNGILFGPASGSINGTTRLDNESFRVGNGTGVYGLGAARQIEFGMRVEF
jgi:hypothetical protein